MNLFKRKQKNLDAAEGAEEGGELAVNEAAAKRQKLALYGGGGVLAAVAMAWILAPSTDPKDGKLADGGDKSEVKVSAPDLVNRNMSEAEWMARSEGEMVSFNNQIKGLEGQSKQLEGMQAQIQALQAEKSAMVDDGTRVLGAYEQENEQLKAQLAEAKRAPAPGPTGLYGKGAPATYNASGVAPGSPLANGGAALPLTRSNEIKLVSFEGGTGGGTGNRIAPSKATSYTDSPNYLPPNSIAHATVVVGVDAAANVKSQADPLPVVLRITGPARSVYSDGKLLRTRVDGCMVNGAAQGDLSSEKVYVKLQRMTCPQPGGRFAVSEVKGFVAFGGKTGVRGRVVSREGALAMQAFLAGLVGGAGMALNTAFQQPLATLDADGDGGINRTPSIGNVGLRALGGGAQTSGKNVQEYLIERAEQYQPVIEMPTGIGVEVVFLEGVFIRN
ncbi:conjugal transfer pilus assembly protein TraB [Novosphingobium chloroacetimidivorans]|uniref:Conjugal transfer pilus assembly protein TraB n=1 Tax=Novosphingobium chloroacetimidivorans TaxID=1428314 RepID=A0A7W7NXC6_9SPHN|nr:TraB/VirB10 family protein [Novosphingobium chloroacetimidivorans]MBB4860528.1 conjugal transfer pilus assembly protein TraB [Novosphingobium chloroacetimidivorans]